MQYLYVVSKNDGGYKDKVYTPFVTVDFVKKEDGKRDLEIGLVHSPYLMAVQEAKDNALKKLMSDAPEKAQYLLEELSGVPNGYESYSKLVAGELIARDVQDIQLLIGRVSDEEWAEIEAKLKEVIDAYKTNCKTYNDLHPLDKPLSLAAYFALNYEGVQWSGTSFLKVDDKNDGTIAITVEEARRLQLTAKQKNLQELLTKIRETEGYSEDRIAAVLAENTDIDAQLNAIKAYYNELCYKYDDNCECDCEDECECDCEDDEYEGY